MILGSILGAKILESGGLSLESYKNLFRFGSFFRLFPIIFVLGLFEVKIKPRTIFLRFIGVRPALGGISKPVLYTKVDDYKIPHDD
jgi:hypothetical protein